MITWIALCDPPSSPAFSADLSLTITQLVASAGNHGSKDHPDITIYPAKFADPDTKNDFSDFKGNRMELAEVVDNLIVISGASKFGKRRPEFQKASWMTSSAPAEDVWVPTEDNDYGLDDGTSFGT